MRHRENELHDKNNKVLHMQPMSPFKMLGIGALSGLLDYVKESQMKLLVKSIFVLLFLTTAATADQMPVSSLPKALLYQNQPIAPRCFEGKVAVLIKECTHDSTSNEKVSGHNAYPRRIKTICNAIKQ